MTSKNTAWLRIAGGCGLITPIVAFTCILLAIFYYPQFSWTDNALSDLGVVPGATAILFNSGLIISGILTLLFASGLYLTVQETALGRTGALIFILDSLALTAIGIFPENMRPMHFYASVTFFMLFPLSMLAIGIAYVIGAHRKRALFTFSVAAFAAVIWILEFLLRLVPGVAIPEALSAISASVWSMVHGVRMMREFSS